jgi:hypothetical protein
MKLFLFTFGLMGLSLFGMCIGLFFARPPIKGSCGGLGKIAGLKCGACSNQGKCKKKNQDQIEN